MRRLNNPVAQLVLLEVWLALGYALHVGNGGVSILTGPVSVMIVEETEDRGKIAAGQFDIITSNSSDSLRVWLTSHGEQDAAGSLRVVDKDDRLDQDLPKWQKAFSAKGPTVPWLVVVRGDSVLCSEAMPTTSAATMAIVKRYGGE